MKPKHCLKILKCTLASVADEELVSDFIAHSSSIEMLVIHLLLNPGILLDSTSPTIDTFSDNGISIELNVTELKKNNTKIFPPLLSEFIISGAYSMFPTEDMDFSASTIKNFISILSHWKLSLQYLRYSFGIDLTLTQSKQIFKTQLDCPILKELDFRSKIKGQFEYFSPHKRLQSLTLYCPDYGCNVLCSLKDNGLHIKSLKLTCHFDCKFDEAIGEYLQTDTSLEELTLHYIEFKSNISHYFNEGAASKHVSN